jgi:hypothetical protein
MYNGNNFKYLKMAILSYGQVGWRSASVTPAAASTLNTGIYAVYKAENNANDSLGLRNGTPYGGLTYSTGKSGNAFTFNGTSAEVALSDNFRFTGGEFSVSFWVYPTDVTNAQGVVTNFYQTNFFTIYWGWLIWLYNGKITFSRCNGTTTPYSLDSNTLSINTWYHVTFTRSNSNNRTRCYINGSLVSSDTDTHTISYDTAHYPRIGSRNSYGTTDLFMKSGSKIDEVYFHNREITQAEVTELQTKYYPY